MKKKKKKDSGKVSAIPDESAGQRDEFFADDVPVSTAAAVQLHVEPSAHDKKKKTKKKNKQSSAEEAVAADSSKQAEPEASAEDKKKEKKLKKKRRSEDIIASNAVAVDNVATPEKKKPKLKPKKDQKASAGAPHLPKFVSTQLLCNINPRAQHSINLERSQTVHLVSLPSGKCSACLLRC